MKPFAGQMSSFEAKMTDLTGEVEALKMQDCASEAEDDELITAGATSPRGADKRKGCERAGSSPARKKHGT